MPTDKIKLSELRTVRDKMDLAIERAMQKIPDISEFPEIVNEMGPDDVASIVATHNAADALIEAVRAAMEYFDGGDENRNRARRRVAYALSRFEP